MASGPEVRVTTRRVRGANVAATGTWTDPDGVRRPAGEVHAWLPGTNQTVCGVPLARAGLARFPHVTWADADPASGAHADAVVHVCRRCAAGTGARRDTKPWRRVDPRP